MVFYDNVDNCKNILKDPLFFGLNFVDLNDFSTFFASLDKDPLFWMLN
jgi:hypothetical protein